MATMDRLIWVTWRAFWIGLGASAVLIVQAFAVPTGAASSGAPEAAVRQTAPTKTNDRMDTDRSAAPILSRNPFVSKTGPRVSESPKHPRGV